MKCAKNTLVTLQRKLATYAEAKSKGMVIDFSAAPPVPGPKAQAGQTIVDTGFPLAEGSGLHRLEPIFPDLGASWTVSEQGFSQDL